MQEKIDKLFRLIKSMEPSEKVFFKKMANMYRKSGTSSYVTLFDAIDKQKEYNEEKLIKKLKGTNFVKHLAVSKNNLYDNILRSLRQYRSGKNLRTKVYQNLQDIFILMEMDFHDDILKKIEATKKIAWEIGELGALYTLTNYEHAVHRVVRSKQAAQKLQQSNEEMKKILSYQHDFHQYITLYDKVLDLRQQYGKIEINEFKKIAQILLDNELLEDGKAPPIFVAQYCFLITKINLMNILGRNEEALEYTQKAIALWHENPAQVEIVSTPYWRTLGMFIYIAQVLNKVQAVKDILDDILKMPRKSQHAKIDFFNNFHLYYSIYLLMARDFEKLEAAVAVYQEEEKAYKAYRTFKDLHNEQALYYNYIIAYINIGAYEKALHWNLRSLDLPEKLIIPNWYYMARLTEILIHYTLGNDYLLEGLIRSIERKLRKENALDDYKKSFLNLFKALNHTAPSDKKTVLEKYISMLSESNDPAIAKNASEGFDIILWMQASINKKTMQEEFIAKKHN